MQRNTITRRRILDSVGLMYCLPLAVGALFAGCQLWREIFLRGKTWKVADQRGYGEAPTPAPARRRTRALL